MKASELRIGNLIMFNGNAIPLGFEELEAIYWNNCNDNGSGEMHPIPLTEEWLLKFGFEKINEICYQLYLNDFFNLQISTVDFEYILWSIGFDNYSKGIEIKYVHKLQNLYFALTNEELEWKK